MAAGQRNGGLYYCLAVLVGHLDTVCPEGVGGDEVAPRLDVAAVDLRNLVGVGDVQHLGHLGHDAPFLEFGAEGAVENHYLFA